MRTTAPFGRLLHSCAAPGCRTFTLGILCVEHEPSPLRVFPRGRPFTGLTAASGAPVLVAVAQEDERVVREL
jgi:hypothetical protein